MEETAGAVDWSVGRYERTAAALAPAAAVLVAVAGLRPGERVVDVGCGTGDVALLAAAAGAQVVAVDPAPRLLDVTREEARRRDLDVTCERGVASSLPVPDGSCDCLLSGFGVIFSPDAEATAGEVARVLTAGGRLLLTAWLPGGALGALAMTAERLVRAATGAPPPSPGFAWHDPTSLGELFAPHDMATSVDGPHELVFSAGSPEEYLDAELEHHPLARTGFGALREHGAADAAHAALLQVLRDHNESSDAFRSTSRYVVVTARRG